MKIPQNTTEKTAFYVKKFIEKHGDTYDYSEVKYKTYKVPVKIICRVHGEFLQRPSTHIAGSGCPTCMKLRKTHTKTTFIQKARNVHGNEYVYDIVEYVNTKTPVTIICKEHGPFEQQPKEHLRYGCLKCGRKKTLISNQRDITWFLHRAHEIHGNSYDYSKSQYNGTLEPLIIICPKHGEFRQKPNYHLNAGTGCPSCIQSSTERLIFQYLKERQIDFICEYKVKIKNQRMPYRFDFYLPNHNLLIEYDGEHHFRPVNFNGIDNIRAQHIFDKTKERDKIKDEYARGRGINLLRIRFDDQDPLSIIGAILT